MIAAALMVPEWAEALKLDLLFRLLLATLLGGVVGLERELSGKPAGLRTNILICVGATLLMEVSMAVARSAGPGQPGDPARIAAQVVSGIGFIGAGTILVLRGHVIGLTTAATLWVVAAIGLAVGARAYVEAIGTTALVTVTLITLRWIEEYILRRRAADSVELVLEAGPDVLQKIEALFAAEGVRAARTTLEKAPGEVRVAYDLAGPTGRRHEAVRRLADEPLVRKISVA
ncbi:MAG: MgtC/SapB family protein [Gemmatimonadetes bacterium]|nr:MgtC/SapB family protein [Gemmatimonadota bacterium]